jgi:hypothetical protein
MGNLRDKVVQRKFALAMTWLALALVAAATYAADPSTVTEGSEEKAERGDLTEINKQLTNPVSELWSITFQQNNFRITPGIPFDQGERWSSNLLFQPVLPIALTPNWNLITRPVIPLFVSQPHPQADDPTHLDRTTAFGDITLLQLLSPSPKLVGNWLLGVGPSWIFPAGTSMWTSNGKWQVGPAVLAGYLSEKWILGALFQNWTSFGGSGPTPTNSMNLQPVAAYFLPDGWSVGYSGNILANWKTSATNAYTVPIGVSVSKVLKLGPLPVRFALAGQWMPVHPTNFGQVWDLQLTIAPVLPKLVRGNLLDPESLQFGLRK